MDVFFFDGEVGILSIKHLCDVQKTLANTHKPKLQKLRLGLGNI